MSQYISQMRRGVKDDSIGRDDWAEYEKQPNHMMPLEGELVLEYDNGIPRLKIGNGKDPFSKLPYMSVDSFILPTQASVTIYPDRWEEVRDESGGVVANRFYQYVTVQNAVITPNSKIDLQIAPNDLLVFHEKDLTFTTINSNGTVRVCIVGQKPTNTYTLKAVVTEVVTNE
jgi:hypothetical protein